MLSRNEQFLEEAREWVGKESEIRWGKYPVEYEPVRRWCRMVDCINPLYLDEDYAKRTRWGGTVCPPLMISQFADGDVGAASEWPLVPGKRARESLPSIPANRSLGVRRKFKFFKPVRIGDRLGSTQRVADICLRPTRFSPETFWVTTEIRCFNQHNDMVATLTRTGIRYQSSGQKKAAIAPPEPQQSDIPSLAHGISWQEKQVYFEEVEEEQELPGFSMLLDSLRFHLQSSGSQQFGLMHVDEDYARGMGIPHTFLDHGFTQAALSRVVLDWMGKGGWLDEFDMEMKKMNFFGDTVTPKGRVTRKYLREGQGCVECELWIENPRHGAATVGRATVLLPSRSALMYKAQKRMEV